MRLILIATLWLLLSGPAIPPVLRVSAAAGTLQPGSVLLLTIDGDEPLPPLRVRAFGRELAPFSVSPRRAQVLVGIDLDVKPGRHPVTIGTPDQAEASIYTTVVQPRRFPTRTLRVDPDLVNPPPAEMDRIAREAERLRALWAAAATDRLWDGAFHAPVPDAPNSSFGTRSIYNGQSRSPHGGTDFLSPSGRPIKAPNAGRVVLAGSLYFTGGTVVIDHGLGVLSLFAHMSTIDVHEGDMVKADAVIGAVGATGRVTGPHLHWAVRLAGARVDPLALVAATAGQ
jgi:murein DD-endopeptidase MepM/ murein hydrolase activator NlpD